MLRQLAATPGRIYSPFVMHTFTVHEYQPLVQALSTQTVKVKLGCIYSCTAALTHTHVNGIYMYKVNAGHCWASTSKLYAV